MAAPYSDDLRHRILMAYDRGMETKEVAEAFSVSPAWARRVKQRRREEGELTHRSMGGKRFEKIDRLRLAELVGRHPDATLDELRSHLGVACALSAIWYALRALQISYKKRRSTPRSRTVRMSRSAGPSGSSGVWASTRVA
jgi:transposase